MAQLQAGDLALSRENLSRAYPWFYGMLVSASRGEADAEGKYRITVKLYPYMTWDGEAKEFVKSEGVGKDGTYTKTYLVGPGYMDKSYTDIFKLTMGLKEQKVANGDIALAVGHEGWFKATPGNFSNIFPSGAPKGSTTPPPPEDFDFEQWQADHAAEEEDAENGIDSMVPDELHAALIEAVAGKTVNGAIRALTAPTSPVNGFDVPTIQSTLEKLVAAGRLAVDAGKYQALVAA